MSLRQDQTVGGARQVFAGAGDADVFAVAPALKHVVVIGGQEVARLAGSDDE